MVINWENEWDKIYKQHGEIQSEILSSVFMAVRIFKEYKCKKIMDLGCGTGRHTIFLAKNDFNVIASDISETGLKTTENKANKLGLKNIEYLQNDMRNIPLSENTLDGLLCVWTTGHGMLIDMEKNAEEIYRILKPNGIVIIDYVSIDDKHYGKGIEIDENTFLDNMEREEKIPHHSSSRKELENIYKKFNEIKIEPINYYYGNDNEIKAYLIIGIK